MPPPPDVPPTLPLWIRAVLATDRGTAALARAMSATRDELLLAWVPPDRRAHITEALYASQATYAPGGRAFDQGLFDWETSAFEHPRFPRAGRILVGGAGGGREMKALRERGYEVAGFDPCEPLVRSGQARFASDRQVTLLRGSYDDLVRVGIGEDGPLTPLLSGPPFDAVVLGWGSFSYVRSAEDSVALLRAVRALAPAAPVLLSFLRPAAGGDAGAARLRALLRRLFQRLGAPGSTRDGDAFAPWSGFYRAVAMEEVGTLATRAGYEVAILRADWYAHALLVPRPDAPGTFPEPAS